MFSEIDLKYDYQRVSVNVEDVQMMLFRQCMVIASIR